MFLTRDKIVYMPYEHLTKFHLHTLPIPGYEFLHTLGEYTKYGINTVPVYIMRDMNIETMASEYRIRPEYPWEDKNLSEEQRKLMELKTKLYQMQIVNLYDSVKIFPKKKHKLNGGIEVSEFLSKYMAPFEGYKVNELTVRYYKDEEDKSMAEIDCKNFVPVICEKNLGEPTYNNPGIPLEMEDTIYLTLKNKKEGKKNELY